MIDDLKLWEDETYPKAFAELSIYRAQKLARKSFDFIEAEKIQLDVDKLKMLGV